MNSLSTSQKSAQDDAARLQQSHSAPEAQVCSEGIIQKPGYEPYKGRWKLVHTKPIVTASALATRKRHRAFITN